jgi:lipid II:glycine glycyltransferase (peptidoglycan interpeptide bridge formation enzyme)
MADLSSLYSFGIVSHEAWDMLVLTSDTSSIFNHREFLSVLGTDIQYWGVFEKNELMAATTVQTDHDGNVIGPDKSFNYYQGLLLSPLITRLPAHSRVRREMSAVGVLIEGLTATYDEIWLSLHPKFRDIRALQWFNYHQPERGQFEIDIRYTGLLELHGIASRDALVSMLARGRQGDFKKAMAKGITVRSITDASILNELHEKTFARQDADRGYLDQLLQPITRKALENEYGELLVAFTSEDIPVSAALFIWDGSTAYYLFGASDPDYRNTGAATFVLVESIWHAIKRNNISVDFVGINSPNRGEYKTSFGAVPFPYFDAHWKRVK